MTEAKIPIINDPKRPEVKQIKILQVKCPSLNCDQVLDITNINEGTKITCPKCSNTTWTPSYREKWYQRFSIYLLSVLLSFAIGVGSSLFASAIWSYYHPIENANVKNK